MNGIDVWIFANLLFSTLLAMWPAPVLAAATRAELQEKGATLETVGAVDVEDKVHARILLLTFHDVGETGTSCSMNNLVPLCHVSHLLGIWPLRHACDRHLGRTDNHGRGAAADPPVWYRFGQLRFC